jgi:hypothetical protein
MHHHGAPPPPGARGATPSRHLTCRSPLGVVATARSRAIATGAPVAAQRGSDRWGGRVRAGNTKTCAPATGAAAMTLASPSGLPRPRAVDPARGKLDPAVGAASPPPHRRRCRANEAALLRRAGAAPPTRGGPTAAVLGAHTGSQPAPPTAAGREGPRRGRSPRGGGRPRRGRPEQDGVQ